MQTGAAYIRVSTDDQLEYSPDSQIKAIKSYSEKNDIYLPDEFIFMDDGISGRTTKNRQAFTKMIALAKTKPKPFDVILVWKYSRFARNREDSIVYKSMLRKQCGINVVSISESIGDDKMSVLFEAMIEAMDEYYSINLAEEVKRGMTEKAHKGGVLSIPPFGYKVEGGVFVPVEEEAVVIKKVFNDYLNGKGFLSIAKELNRLGIRTHRGNMIENRTVEYWLNNPTYVGKIRWNPNGKTSRNYHADGLIIVDGKHQAIIDGDTWLKTQTKLREDKGKYQKYKRAPDGQVSHWLVGLVRCSKCGAVAGNAKGFFVCSKRNRGTCSGDGAMSAKKMEHIVIAELERILKDDVKDIVFSEPIKSTDANSTKDGTLEEIERLNIQRIKVRLERIEEAYEAGVDALDEYKRKKSSLKDELKSAEEKLKEIKGIDEKNQGMNSLENVTKLREKITNIVDILKSDDVDNNRKNAVAKSLIKEVVRTGDPTDPLLITFWA